MAKPDHPVKLRALIVDDHPALVRSVSRLLAFDCEIVGTLGDCVGLVEAVGQLRPDLMVLDVNLPSGDGIVACGELMRHHPALKVIVFTALNDPDVRRRASEAGAWAFVHKLAVEDNLLAAVRRLRDSRKAEEKK